MKIGAKLRELRMSKNLEIKDVLTQLQKVGFQVSEENMQQYEVDAKALDADVFLALCKIYECKDILETFRDFE